LVLQQFCIGFGPDLQYTNQIGVAITAATAITHAKIGISVTVVANVAGANAAGAPSRWFHIGDSGDVVVTFACGYDCESDEPQGSLAGS
jgi:hypothetical protein